MTNLGTAADSLEAFAADLRNLRMSHAAQQNGSFAWVRWRARDVDAVEERHGCSRSAIYSALSGKTLPQAATLLAMVEMWDKGGADSRLRWLKRRDELQRHLTRSQPGSGGRPAAPSRPETSDEQARALRDYMRELRKEYEYRTIQSIAAEGGGSPVTLAGALRGPHLPSWPTIEVFLRGIEEFDEGRQDQDRWNDPDALLLEEAPMLRMRGLWLAARAARKSRSNR